MLPSYDFNMDFQKAKKKEDEIKQFLIKRTEDISRGLTTSSIDAKLKIKLDDFINSINTMKLGLGQKQNPQLDELFKIYKNFKKEFEELKISVNNSIENSYSKPKIEEDNRPLTRQEYETAKGIKIKEGDEVFDELRGQAKLIRNGAVMIKDHLKMQEPLLDKLNSNFDKVENKMKRSENKLANYLNKSSSSCLYWAILVEFVLLILFFAF